MVLLAVPDAVVGISIWRCVIKVRVGADGKRNITSSAQALHISLNRSGMPE